MPRRTHLVPTHVRTPETLLTLAGFALSVRQFLLLLVGLALSYRVWLLLLPLADLPAGLVLQWIGTVLPAGLALVVALASVAGRPLEVWLVVGLRYLVRPHRFVWRSVRASDLFGRHLEEEP